MITGHRHPLADRADRLITALIVAKSEAMTLVCDNATLINSTNLTNDQERQLRDMIATVKDVVRMLEEEFPEA